MLITRMLTLLGMVQPCGKINPAQYPRTTMLQDCKDHCALTSIHLCSQDFGEAPVAAQTGWGTSLTKTENLNTCAKFLYFPFDKPVKKDSYSGVVTVGRLMISVYLFWAPLFLL